MGRSGLRIVGGELGGLRLTAPASARPTSERTREALASALASRDAIQGRAVLELFAGSGALGFELLSRGASSLVAVELDRAACRCIRESARALGVDARVRVICQDLMVRRSRALERIAEAAPGAFDVVIADPPYALAGELAELALALREAALIREGSLLVLEHPERQAPDAPAAFRCERRYRHGDTGLSLWVAGPDES